MAEFDDEDIEESTPKTKKGRGGSETTDEGGML